MNKKKYKFEELYNGEEVRKAIRHWIFGIDSNDFTDTGIYKTLIWTNEMSDELSWYSVVPYIIKAIPSWRSGAIAREKGNYDINSVSFNRWVNNTEKKIAKAYKKAITRLNEVVNRHQNNPKADDKLFESVISTLEKLGYVDIRETTKYIYYTGKDGVKHHISIQ